MEPRCSSSWKSNTACDSPAVRTRSKARSFAWPTWATSISSMCWLHYTGLYRSCWKCAISRSETAGRTLREVYQDLLSQMPDDEGRRILQEAIRELEERDARARNKEKQ